MQPSFISDFVAEVERTLKIRIVGISSDSPIPGVQRDLLPGPARFDPATASQLSGNCEISWSGSRYSLRIDLVRFLGSNQSPITAVKPVTVFTMEGEGPGQEIDSSVPSELALLYMKFLRSSQQSISEVANQQYLANPSDVIGLRGLIQATHDLVGIDHVAVLRSGLSGTVQILAQHGDVRSLEESDANSRERAASRAGLAATLSERGHRHLPQRHNDPLFPQGSSPDRDVIYVGAERYAVDELKRSALKGMWYRASTANGPLSWEQLTLFNGLAQAMSVITSVGSILTARLVQLQKITHSNSSNLSSMHSTLAEAMSANGSILLASRAHADPQSGTRPPQQDPQMANIESQALQLREHLNYLRLNIQQMQAKVTLSLWLEHEAGLPKQLGLERFNVSEILGEIMACAPALVESWTSDYSGASRPSISNGNRRDDVFIVRSRKDILSFVILNVLENAVKYRSSNRPSLRYEVAHGRDPKTFRADVRIQLTDDGVGVDAADAGSIFDVGWRSQRYYREIPGQGLGLYQSRALLKMVGGDISLTSQRNPTTFTIIVPVE